jgi:(p)ppGpp synthase/HD superfamily hydrolase
MDAARYTAPRDSAVSLPLLVQEMQKRLGDKTRDAYLLAANVHAGQKRESGEEYITHPLAVAGLLFSSGADGDVVCAALLHDVLEEGLDPEQIENDIHATFGDHMVYLVRAVSKDLRIDDGADRQEAYMEQITHAFELDISVFFIKIADLIHNLSTIMSLAPERKERWVRQLKYEYLPLFSDFYHRVPLAHREMYHRLLDAIQVLIDSHSAR